MFLVSVFFPFVGGTFSVRGVKLTVVAFLLDSVFLDTSSFESSRSMDQLPAFLKAFSPKGTDLSKAAEEKGSPHTLVIAPAALRAADLVR